MKPKAIIYARVSTKRQEREGISIPGQISRGEAHLLASGYQVAAIYKEAHSASEKASKRPEFLKAVSHALDKKAGISALWVYDTDRFSRDRIEGPLYKAQLRASGVEIIYHAYQVNPKDINDRLMEGILENLGAYKAALQGLLAARGMHDRAAEGGFTGGSAPFGYMWRKNPSGRSTLVPDPARAPVVRKIVALFMDGLGCIQIARLLNSQNVATARGGKWSNSIVHRLLTNPRMKGANQFNGKEGSVYMENTHEPIITPEEWDQIQEILSARRPFQENKKRISPRRKLKLGGILYCDKCGSAMTGAAATGKNGARHLYYECSCHRKGGTCEGQRIPGEKLDRAMIGFMKEQLFNDENISTMENAVFEYVKTHNSQVEKDRMQLTSELSGIETRLNRLIHILETEKAFDPEDLAPRIRELQAAKKEAGAQLESLRPLPKIGKANRQSLRRLMAGILEDSSPEELVNFFSKYDFRLYINNRDVYAEANPALVFASTKKWRARRDLNPRPSAPEADALSS